MKNTIYTLLTMICACTLSMAQKKQSADPFAFSAKFEVICMGSEMDGTVMVKAFGRGKNKRDAQKQLEKNAMYAILFEGIREGRDGCSPRPVVTEVNARDQYKKYFNRLFDDAGSYKKFVKRSDTPKKSSSQYKSSSSKETLYTSIVTIDVPKLMRRLDKDHVTMDDDKKRTIRKNEKRKG